MMRGMRVICLAVAMTLAACGKDAPERPEAVVERALTLIARDDGVAFTRTLAPEARNGAESDYQRERLWAWLKDRAQLDTVELDGWDAPRAGSPSGSTAQVLTIVRVRVPDAEPPERPVPLLVDLTRAGDHWLITNVKMTPLPAWYTAHSADDELHIPGEPPPPPRPPPPDLAFYAAAFRVPPPRAPN